MAPAAAAVLSPVEPEALMSNGCATVDAMHRQTAAIEALTAELRNAQEALTSELRIAHERLSPAAEAITDLGAAQKKLCAWIVGNRLKITAAIPGALVAVGAISPNAAHLISQWLQAAGVR